MSHLRRWTMAICAVTFLASTARAIGGSGGQVRLDAQFSYAIEDLPGKHTVSASGLGMPLTVGLDKGGLVGIGGSYGSLTKPLAAQVSVPCNAQLLIGGMSQRKATTKVPTLGDVPVVGGLFRTKDRMQEQVNLVIFLTPSLATEPPKSAPFAEIGGPLDLTAGSMKGAVKIDGTFQHYSGSYTLKFDGVIQSGPNAGKKCKGTLKYKFTGDRT